MTQANEEEDYLDILFGEGTDEEIEARLNAYTAGLPADQKVALGPELFLTAPEQANDQTNSWRDRGRD